MQEFGLTITTGDVQRHFASSGLLRAKGYATSAGQIACMGDRSEFGGLTFDSYHASVLADFLRRAALDAGRSFTFETVMSHPDKVELLREARTRGFRTYLCYIATEDPRINVRPVRNRVADGGHDVADEKIVSRYARSLGLLTEAIRHADRAYFFDTSADAAAWYFAEAADGTGIELRSESDQIPRWFEAVWDAFDQNGPGEP